MTDELQALGFHASSTVEVDTVWLTSSTRASPSAGAVVVAHDGRISLAAGSGSGQHGGMRLELKVRRRQWAFFGAFFLIVGIPFAIAAPLLLFFAAAHQNGGALVGVVIGALFGSVLVPAGVAAWRIGRSHPVIVVDDDGLTIEHTGCFVAPVHLSRASVHSVFVGAFQGARTSSSSLPISSWHCPDLSLLHAVEDHNLLIVVADSLPMRGLARRGLGALSLGVARGMSYTGPTKATVARGFFAVAIDENLARRAFGSWSTAEAPDPELREWLSAGTNRGFGWLGWRSRPPQQWS